MRSDSVYESSNLTKIAILMGNIDIEIQYSSLVNAMLEFFDKLVALSNEIGIYKFIEVILLKKN